MFGVIDDMVVTEIIMKTILHPDSDVSSDNKNQMT